MAWPASLSLRLVGPLARRFSTESVAPAAVAAATAPRVKLLPAITKAALPVDLLVQVLQAYAIQPETVDIHVQVSMADKTNKAKLREPIQGVALLPHSFRPEKRVAVFAKGEQANAAREAGAQLVGDSDLIEKVAKGEVANVDIYLSTPDMLRDLRPLSKTLRQSMPTVKKGTVDPNIASRVAVFKRGTQFKSDDAGVILVAVAKTNFTRENIKENVLNFLNSVLAHNQTAGAPFLRKVYLSSTQSPSLLLDLQSILPGITTVQGVFKRPVDKKLVEREKKAAEKKSTKKPAIKA